MLEVKQVVVEAKDHKRILNSVSISINEGEIHAIMGPNGTGKSTLSKVLMGHEDYRVVSGEILWNHKSILSFSVDERARLGIFLANQNPISIEGVSNSEFLKTALRSVRGENVGIYEFMKLVEKAGSELNLPASFLHRSINQDFSGGERKKNEILQMKILKPKLIILDELDSGLDVDSLKIVCQNIEDYRQENPEASLLIITHYSRILEYLIPDYVHIMKNGSIVETSDFSLAKRIEKEGYVGINSMTGMEKDE